MTCRECDGYGYADDGVASCLACDGRGRSASSKRCMVCQRTERPCYCTRPPREKLYGWAENYKIRDIQNGTHFFR